MSAEDETDRVPLLQLAMDAEASRKKASIDVSEQQTEKILDHLEQQTRLLREVLHGRSHDHARHRRIQERFDRLDRVYCELRDEQARHRELFSELDAFTKRLAAEQADRD